MRPETRPKWVMLFVGLALGVLVGRFGFPDPNSQGVANQSFEGKPIVSALVDTGGSSGERGRAEETAGDDVSASGDSKADLKRWSKMVSGMDGNYVERARVYAEIRALGAERAAVLLAELSRSPLGSAEHTLLGIIGEAIGEMDPKLAFELAADSERLGYPIWMLVGGAAKQMIAESPEGALREIDKITNPNTRMAAMYRAMQMLAEGAPDEFERFLKDPLWREKVSQPHPWPLESAMHQWVTIDPARAASILGSLPPGELRDEAFDELASAYVRRDREGAIAWAKGLEDLAERREAMGAMARDLAILDRDAAFALAASVSDQSLAREMAENVMTVWAAEDAAAAFGWLMEQEEGVRRNSMDEWIYAAVQHGTDPLEVIALVEGGAPADQRAELVGRAVSRWSVADPRAAGAWVETIEDPELLDKSREQFFQQTRHRNAEWLAEHVSTVRASDPEAFAGQIGDLASELAEHDPEGALAWAQSLGEDGEGTIPGIVGHWAHRDPAAAAAFVASTGEGLQRSDMIASTVGAWSRSDPAAAGAWVDSLEGAERVAATGALVGGYVAQGDIEGAAQRFEALVGGGEEVGGPQVQNAARYLTRALASRDRQRALGLLDQIENSGVLATATEGLVEVWLSDEPAAASEWVAALEPGQARDRAARQIAHRSMNERDPEAAFAWAATIEGGDRMGLLESSLRQWAREDREAAEAALEAAAVSDADRERLEGALQ